MTERDWTSRDEDLDEFERDLRDDDAIGNDYDDVEVDDE